MRQRNSKFERTALKGTFSPPRLTLLSWAFAAILMGSVGLASYKFGDMDDGVQTVRIAPAAIQLPPAGDVSSTASIARNPGPEDIEVFRLGFPANRPPNQSVDPKKLDALKDEMSSLTRRLDNLLDQNRTYAERISLLEAELANDDFLEQASELDSIPTASGNPQVEIQPAPPQGIVTMSAAPSLQSQPDEIAKRQAPVPSTKPEMIQGPVTAMPGGFKLEGRHQIPRIPLAQDSTDPVTTGSVDAGNTPSSEETAPSIPVLSPSAPAGRTGYGGESVIDRTDFGAVVGEFKDEAEALRAWTHFQEQNVDRMRDLEPLFSKHEDGRMGGTLMVGPFANAADAAVACYYLIALADLCSPVLYTGTPLVAARGA